VINVSMVSGDASAVLIKSLFSTMGLPFSRVSSIMIQPAFVVFIQVHRPPERKDDWWASYQPITKSHKVFSIAADESSGQRGSFRKVAQGRRTISRHILVGAPESGNRDRSNAKENDHVIGCPEQYFCD
jgi:hypothetical protein